jgi:ElaA protein
VAWRLAAFGALSGADVYDILQLRQRVFMLEQAIPVLDADGMDAEALHLLGREAGELVAYARIFAPAGAGDPVKIGRVVVAQSARGSGLGRALMAEAMMRAAEIALGADVKVSAQAHLTAFYESLGFAVMSAIYDDHGVPHVDMVTSPVGRGRTAR